MDIFLEILKYASGIIAGIITVISLIIPYVKNSKVKKALETAQKIGDAVLPYITEAETFLSYSGVEKKAYVMTKANQFAISKGLNFDVEKVSDVIEKLVSFTKTVNKRDVDKTMVV